MSLKIISRRMNQKNTSPDYENPEFLQTIRMPQDSYFLPGHLPEPNYSSPKNVAKKSMLANKTDKSYHLSQGSKLNILPKLARKDLAHNKSLFLKNSSIVGAARA